MNPLFAPGSVAVITGAASGIGRAAAQRFAAEGMSLVLVDTNARGLERLASTLPKGVRTCVADVTLLADVEAVRATSYDTFGAVHVLMNNAAIIKPGTKSWEGLDGWRRILAVNLWGVVNGVHVFAPAMLAQGTRAAIINTGSKQGITNPPGQPAYAVSKAGVKVLTEQLAHELRSEAGERVSAHLLVPGSTFTGMTAAPDGSKPPDAWTAEQVVDRMMDGVTAGDFYIFCEDHAVSSELDALRLRWSVEDIIQNRPALSRWHPDHRDAFAAAAARLDRS